MTQTLLEPVERKQKLVTHVDRATGARGQRSSVDALLDSAGALLGNLAFDQMSREPKMLGPGAWEPGLQWRHDSWVNSATGYGTALDKTAFGNYQASPILSDTACENLFTGDDVTQRGICTVPKEMLRKGYCVELGSKAQEDAETSVLNAADELDANNFFMRAQWWGNLFGDGAVIIGADDGRPAILELIPERVRKIDWLEAYDRRYYAINSYYTSGPKMGKPETYALGNPGQVSSPIQVIHESRMIRFGGAPTTLHLRQARGGFDLSKIQAVYETLRSFATGYKSVEVLLTDGPQGVYKIKNLAGLIASGNKSLFEQRLQTVDLFRSAMRAVVVDADTENFERASFSFSGIPDILERLEARLAAGWHMPVSKLMGQGPAGMNATGEFDSRTWYDELETDQVNELSGPLRRFYKILCATKEGPTKGAVPPTIQIKFNPLYTLDPKAEAERRQIVATTDKVYFDIGAATGEEIALTRFTERGYSAEGIQIDRDLRQTLVEQDREAALSDSNPVPPKDALTPTSNEAVITVDEARAMLNLGPDPDPLVGAMKVSQYKAQQEAASAPGAHPTDPEQNKPNGFDVPDPAEVAKQEADAQAAALAGNQNGNPRKDPDSAGAQGPKGTAPKAPTKE